MRVYIERDSFQELSFWHDQPLLACFVTMTMDPNSSEASDRLDWLRFCTSIKDKFAAFLGEYVLEQVKGAPDHGACSMFQWCHNLTNFVCAKHLASCAMVQSARDSHWRTVMTAVLLQGAAPSGTDQAQTLDRMPVYMDRLHLMKEEGRTTLLVDFEHLNDYDGELAEVRCRPA